MDLGAMGSVLAALIPLAFLFGAFDVATRWLWMAGASTENDE
jgi:hypothetical protein